MKNKRLYLSISLILAAIAGIYFAYRKGLFSSVVSANVGSLVNADFANSGGFGPHSGTQAVKVSYCDTVADLDYNKTLSIGDKGPEVCDLQKWLNLYRAQGTDIIAIDGIFGPKTQKALLDITNSPSINLLELITL